MIDKETRRSDIEGILREAGYMKASPGLWVKQSPNLLIEQIPVTVRRDRGWWAERMVYLLTAVGAVVWISLLIIRGTQP